MIEKDLYKILNVDENATLEDIKKQYKILALKHHPDKNQGNDTIFKDIQEAYNILSNEDKRKQYDTSKFKYCNKSNVNTLFNNLFASSVQQQKIRIKVSFCDIIYGCYKSFKIKMTFPCQSCNETGIENPERNTIQCRECFGKGVNPTINFLSCMTCNGKGVFVLNNKKCLQCNGNKHIDEYEEKSIYVKPGVPDNDIIRINENVIVIIEHEYDKKTYKIDNLDIYVKVEITLFELLSGFNKMIKVGEESYVLDSKEIFDCKKPFVIVNKGIRDIGSLIIEFILNIDHEDKLIKKLSRSMVQMVNKKDLPITSHEIISIH